MENHIRWSAQTIHQAYHLDGYWWTCAKNTCDSAQRVLDIDRYPKLGRKDTK